MGAPLFALNPPLLLSAFGTRIKFGTADDDTVWLTQAQLARLFGVTQQNISLHISNVLEEGELDNESTVKDFLLVRSEGKRQVARSVVHYNLDMIISVGYRVKSKTATRFRIWATGVLRDHLARGYTVNRPRLRETGYYGLLEQVVEELRDLRRHGLGAGRAIVYPVTSPDEWPEVAG